MFQTLPIAELDSNSPINQARLAKRNNEHLMQDDLGETLEESSHESFQIIKDVFADQLEKENLINTYQKASDMIICPTLECITDLIQVEEIAKKEIIT